MDKKRKLFVVIGSIAIIATATIGGTALFTGGSTAPTVTASSNNTPASTSVSSTNTSSSASSTSSYKDGTYTASTSYTVPGGANNSIDTTLTISGGKVTAVTARNGTYDRQSQNYVDWFEQQLDSEIVGQSVEGLSPNRIGGASLTTYAFDQTLDTIRNDANS